MRPTARHIMIGAKVRAIARDRGLLLTLAGGELLILAMLITYFAT